MKFIYILNHFSSTQSSHFNHTINLLEELASLGIQTTLLIEKADDLPVFNRSEVSVIALKSSNRILRYLELIKALFILNKSGYNVAYVRITSITSIFVSVVAHWLNMKSLFWQSGTTIEWDLSRPLSVSKVKWYLKSYLMSKIARRICSHFVTGPETMVDYYASVAKVNREKIICLPNDIDVKRFAPISKVEKGELRAKYGLSDREFVLSIVHRFSEVRETTNYISEILKYFPKIIERLGNVTPKFLLVGDGPELEVLKEQVNSTSYSNYFEFKGVMANNSVHEIYQISDVFLQPSLNEGFPRVLIEAMAVGLPIVSTDAGGVLDIVSGKQLQFISHREKYEEFSEKLLSLLEYIRSEGVDDLHRTNIVQAALFSTPNVAKKYVQVLKGLQC